MKKHASDEQRRVEGFQAILADHKHSDSYFEEMDGSHQPWQELSTEGKLTYLARDAVFYDVPFDYFAKAVREVLGDQPPAAREEAALRLLLAQSRELHALEKLLPDLGSNFPPPLTDRFQNLFGRYEESMAEMKASHDIVTAALTAVREVNGPAHAPVSDVAKAIFGESQAETQQ